MCKLIFHCFLGQPTFYTNKSTVSDLCNQLVEILWRANYWTRVVLFHQVTFKVPI